MRRACRLAPAPDPRSFAPSHRPLTGLAALQRVAGNRATAAAIQRLVLTIGNDRASAQTTANLVGSNDGTDRHPSARLPAAAAAPPLSDLGPEETLHVVGHGDEQARIEGMDARAFVDHLVARGFTKDHHGSIKLVTCHSATPTAGGIILGDEIMTELRRRGFQNAVISFDGLVRVRTDGTVGVVPRADVPAYRALMDWMDRTEARLEAIGREFIRLSAAPVVATPGGATVADIADADVEAELAELGDGSEEQPGGPPAPRTAGPTAAPVAPLALSPRQQKLIEERERLQGPLDEAKVRIEALTKGQVPGATLRYVPWQGTTPVKV